MVWLGSFQSRSNLVPSAMAFKQVKLQCEAPQGHLDLETWPWSDGLEGGQRNKTLAAGSWGKIMAALL